MKEDEDAARPLAEKESSGSRKIRRAALVFYLNTVLRLNISFKDYLIKGTK